MTTYSGFALSTIVLIAQAALLGKLEQDLAHQAIIDIIHHEGICHESFREQLTPEEAVENLIEVYHNDK